MRQAHLAHQTGLTRTGKINMLRCAEGRGATHGTQVRRDVGERLTCELSSGCEGEGGGMTSPNTKSPWYTESTIPPIDYAPVTPTPRKYVLRGLKRGAFAALTAIVAIAVLGAFWWLFCLLYAR